MRKLLDCSNVDSTFDCVTNLLGMHREDIEAKIHSANEDDWPDLSYDELIRQFIFDDKNFCLPEPEVAFWFHTTRIAKGTLFKDGLKPTSEMIPQLLEILASLAEELGLCSRQDFGHLGKNGNDAYRIGFKCSSKGLDDGPHGFLIRETVMSLYFEAPEFIREYCRSIPGKIGEPLLREFRNRTFPAIVKFQSSFQTRGTTQTALMYLIEKTQKRDNLSDYCNRGIGIERHQVCSSDIESIEFLD